MEEELKKELQELASFLQEKKINDPPENYFDTFPEKVLSRWKEEKGHAPVRRVQLTKWISIAAIAISVLFAGWWWLRQDQPNGIQEISSAEAYQYVFDHIEDFDGLMQAESQWPAEEKLIIPEPSAVEDYLLEELQGKDAEQIF